MLCRLNCLSKETFQRLHIFNQEILLEYTTFQHLVLEPFSNAIGKFSDRKLRTLPVEIFTKFENLHLFKTRHQKSFKLLLDFKYPLNTQSIWFSFYDARIKITCCFNLVSLKKSRINQVLIFPKFFLKNLKKFRDLVYCPGNRGIL